MSVGCAIDIRRWLCPADPHPRPDKAKGGPDGHPARRELSDDIRDQVILDQRDLVLQLQLALLQPGDLELVNAAGRGQRVDRRVKVAMLDSEHFQTLAHFVFVHAALPCADGLVRGRGPLVAVRAASRYPRPIRRKDSPRRFARQA